MPVYWRKLSSGIKFFYKFDINGRTHRSKCIYLSKRECAAAERERFNQLDEERRFGKQDNPISLSLAISDRLKFLEIKYSPKHRKESAYYLGLFLDYSGDIDIREINYKLIDDFLLDYSENLIKKGFDNYQANSALKTIKALINYTITRQDLTIKNPCNKIKPFPVNKSFKYIPSDDEIELLRTRLNDRQKLLFDFVLESGCRINEALNLCFEDIKEDYLILYTKKSRNSNKTPRKVPIPKCLIGLNGSGKVFPDWTELPKFLDKTLRRNKMKIWGWHNLRHRYASLLSKSGEPLFSIMSKLGHSNLSTTQGYLQSLQ